MPIQSVPMLLAASSGIPCAGEHRCFYCAAPCGETRPTSIHVKDSFTGRSGVRSPGSPWVCEGCVLCLRESADIKLIDGETRSGQLMRGYSWVLTEASVVAATKAHLLILRRVCLAPPHPPFAVVLSDSGQTHQLYRGVVNHDRSSPVITLESEPIGYRPGELATRLALCGRIVAATGKPALREPVNARMALSVLERYRGGESILAEWSRAREQPLSRLASWLVAPREESALEFPADQVQDQG